MSDKKSLTQEHPVLKWAATFLIAAAGSIASMELIEDTTVRAVFIAFAVCAALVVFFNIDKWTKNK